MTAETSKAMIKAVEVGMEYAKGHPTVSRFDICNYLYGYNPRLSFNQLTAISREIACRLGKGVNW